MNLYLSHSTALRFWRAWSAAAAVPLHAFHDLGAAEAALFPDRFFAASEVLFRAVRTDREIREALRRAAAPRGLAGDSGRHCAGRGRAGGAGCRCGVSERRDAGDWRRGGGASHGMLFR